MATLAEEMLKGNKTPEQTELEKQELVKTEENKLEETKILEEEEKKKRGRPAKNTKEELSVVEEDKDKAEIEEEFNEAEIFYKELSNITGDDIEQIDFGNTDPLSPQGVAKLIEYKTSKVQQEIEEYLAQVAPLEYQALLLRIEGKDPSELYNKVGFKDYNNLVIEEDDVKTQKEIIYEDLKQQGVTEDRITKMIKMIENEGELFEEASKSKNNLASLQKQNFEYETENIKKQKQLEREYIENFNNLVNETIGKGEIGNFIIPEKDKNNFYEFVRKNVIFNNGEFYVSNRIAKENYEEVMKSFYFQYKGGDLKSLIEKEAKKQNVSRLRSIASASKNINGDDLSKNDSKKTGAKHWSEEIGIIK